MLAVGQSTVKKATELSCVRSHGVHEGHTKLSVSCQSGWPTRRCADPCPACGQTIQNFHAVHTGTMHLH